jgi:molecular chaperone DnaJ
VVVHVRPHEVFERRATEIVCEVPLAFTTAALGGKITVPTLGGEAELRIPPGTQTGASFRLKGKGLPDLHGSHRGDQHVVVRVQVPERLNEKQRRLLEAFAQAGGDHVEQEKSLFDKVKDGLGK